MKNLIELLLTIYFISGIISLFVAVMLIWKKKSHRCENCKHCAQIVKRKYESKKVDCELERYYLKYGDIKHCGNFEERE